jgi:hypothetical protein
MPVTEGKRQFTPRQICITLDVLEHKGWLRTPEPATPA